MLLLRNAALKTGVCGKDRYDFCRAHEVWRTVVDRHRATDSLPISNCAARILWQISWFYIVVLQSSVGEEHGTNCAAHKKTQTWQLWIYALNDYIAEPLAPYRTVHFNDHCQVCPELQSLGWLKYHHFFYSKACWVSYWGYVLACSLQQETQPKNGHHS